MKRALLKAGLVLSPLVISGALLIPLLLAHKHMEEEISAMRSALSDCRMDRLDAINFSEQQATVIEATRDDLVSWVTRATAIAEQLRTCELKKDEWESRCWHLPKPFRRLGAFEITAYTAAEGAGPPGDSEPDGMTATGWVADPALRIVAVDPTVIPYNSKVWIQGLGWYNAQDCGRDIKGKRLDILMATKTEAFNWGRRKRQVVVAYSG